MTDKEMIKRHKAAMKALLGKKYFVSFYMFLAMALLFPAAGCLLLTILSVNENKDMFFLTATLPLLTGLYGINVLGNYINIFPAKFTPSDAKTAKSEEMMRKAYNGCIATADMCACFPVNRAVLVKGLCRGIAPVTAFNCLSVLYLAVLSVVSDSTSVKIYAVIIVVSMIISTIYGESLFLTPNQVRSGFLTFVYCLMIISCMVLVIGSLIMDENLVERFTFLQIASGIPLIILSVIFAAYQIYLLKIKLPKDAEGKARNGERAEVLG